MRERNRWNLSYDEKVRASDIMDRIGSMMRTRSKMRESVEYSSPDLDLQWKDLSDLVDEMYDVMRLPELKAENKRCAAADRKQSEKGKS